MLQALARRYRPKNFDQVVGQNLVVRTLRNALSRQHLHHAYLFTGTRGVGKTTIARIIAKSLNCETGITATPCEQCPACQEISEGRFSDLLEVDAASRTKVEDIRELLDNVQYAPTVGRYKIYLIDEVHMLSGHSFNALLKTLEEPPPHVIFLLATTDHQRLPATILSRCLQFHLQQIPPELISKQLQHILQQEHIPFTADATHSLAKAANGSMRDALSLLDQAIAYGNGEVHDAEVKAMLGTIETTAIYDILQALKKQQPNTLLNIVETLAEKSNDFSQALGDLITAFHQLATLQVAPNRQTHTIDKEIAALSQELSPEDIQLYYQIALLGQRDLPYAPSTRIGFEMTLLRMLAFTPNKVTSIKKESETIKPVKEQYPTTKTATKPSLASWNDLINELNLSGLTLALAQQCQQINITDTELQLALSPKQKPLLQKKHIDRIQSALTEYFSQPMLVDIKLMNTEGKTPAEFKKRKEADRLAAAENRIMSDQKIQKIIKTFDATVIKDSIITSQ